MWRPILAAALLLAFPAAADDGRVEINQAVVAAAGGFPYVISAPGSYVLTGDLVVPASTRAIDLEADDITLDLNGFTIRGPYTCNFGSCSLGTTVGIVPFTGAFGKRATVRNGTVRGFSGGCLGLRDHGHVENVAVRDCGAEGIGVLNGIVIESRVQSVGASGIVLGAGGVYRDNFVTDSALGVDPNAHAIRGGSATGGNFCSDGSCSPRGMRRYYLSKTPVNGAGPLAACDVGFHMASAYELLDPSTLHYDVSRGVTKADSGGGPPVEDYGWARSGFLNNTVANCVGWTSPSFDNLGLVLRLPFPGGSSFNLSPWSNLLEECSDSFPTWCIEN